MDNKNTFDKSKLFAEIAETIHKYVHQESDRRILGSILAQTVELNNENEILRGECIRLQSENDVLQTYRCLYEDFFKPGGKNIEFQYRQTDSEKWR